MHVSQKGWAVGVWLAAGLMLAAGYTRIELHDVKRAVVAEATAKALQTRIDRARRIVRNRVVLRAARKNIVNDIGGQSGPNGRNDVGSLLVALDRTTRRSGLAILAVEPHGGEAAPSKDGWLRARAVKLVLRGSFDRFLAFLPMLTKDDPLVLVRAIGIVPAGRSRVGQSLVFTLDTSVYTVHQSASKE